MTFRPLMFLAVPLLLASHAAYAGPTTSDEARILTHGQLPSQPVSPVALPAGAPRTSDEARLLAHKFLPSQSVSPVALPTGAPKTSDEARLLAHRTLPRESAFYSFFVVPGATAPMTTGGAHAGIASSTAAAAADAAASSDDSRMADCAKSCPCQRG